MRLKQLILLCVFLIISGCGDAKQERSEGSSPPSPEVASQADHHEPPVVRVIIGEESFHAIRGSYCWNSEGTGSCVDVSSYEKLVAKQKAPPKAECGGPVELLFDSPPDELTVMASFPGEERPDEALAVEDGRFHLAVGSGKQLYIIQAQWPQGSSDYIFEVESQAPSKQWPQEDFAVTVSAIGGTFSSNKKFEVAAELTNKSAAPVKLLHASPMIQIQIYDELNNPLINTFTRNDIGITLTLEPGTAYNPDSSSYQGGKRMLRIEEPGQYKLVGTASFSVQADDGQWKTIELASEPCEITVGP
ncbi:hypothetical protein [Paenibacillus nasutitermitis]|uniref:Uncharacterized protein n=1 Tax=Paenibacillus nasutitermitis TaxID=1652958 RepID=A0A917E335_9BACL|nr:hypothetical protein [Paenibacillus nasutitermitis]GGD98171.1 hypothetical protein GCM10010911_66210 [Paenibacillus nasutitermitis]